MLFWNQKLRKPAVAAILLFVIVQMLWVMGVCPMQVQSHRVLLLEGPALDLMLCCHHPDMLSSIWTRALQFHFAQGSVNYVARAACIKKKSINICFAISKTTLLLQQKPLQTYFKHPFSPQVSKPEGSSQFNHSKLLTSSRSKLFRRRIINDKSNSEFWIMSWFEHSNNWIGTSLWFKVAGISWFLVRKISNTKPLIKKLVNQTAIINSLKTY